LWRYFGEELDLLQIIPAYDQFRAECAVPHGLEDGMKTNFNKIGEEFAP
jgi:hypothetical protein